jgi:hypothetical protein
VHRNVTNQEIETVAKLPSLSSLRTSVRDSIRKGANTTDAIANGVTPGQKAAVKPLTQGASAPKPPAGGNAPHPLFKAFREKNANLPPAVNAKSYPPGQEHKALQDHTDAMKASKAAYGVLGAAKTKDAIATGLKPRITKDVNVTGGGMKTTPATKKSPEHEENDFVATKYKVPRQKAQMAAEYAKKNPGFNINE